MGKINAAAIVSALSNQFKKAGRELPHTDDTECTRAEHCQKSMSMSVVFVASKISPALIA